MNQRLYVVNVNWRIKVIHLIIKCIYAIYAIYIYVQDINQNMIKNI